jgi:DNA-binding transcriptional ArsR family regulator
LKRFPRLLVRIRLALRLDRRLTSAEASRLFELALSILAEGRLLQSSYQYRMRHVMVDVGTLAYRLEEKPEAIRQALRLLREMGYAERFNRQGRWTLDLANTSEPLRRGSSAGR